MDKVLKKKKWSARNWIIISITVLFAGLVAIGYAWSGKSRLNVDAEKITIEEVTYGSFRELIAVNGTVQPLKTVFIEAIEGGTVEEILTEDGKDVAAGTPIVRLNNQQFQMDAINREAQLLDQQNNLRNTRIQMDQQTASLRAELLDIDYQLKDAARQSEVSQKLWKDQAISKNEYEKSQENYSFLTESRKLVQQKIRMDSLFRLNQLGQIESSLDLIHDNLKFLHESVENLLVRAPISGMLSALQVELGETVPQGGRIAQIDVMDGFKVRAAIPEHYVSRVMPGLRSTFMLGTTEYQLEVKKVYPEVTSGEFQVDMHFVSEVPPEIRRGQTLQLRLALGDEMNATLVPRGAFFQSTGGNWIYVLTDEGNAERREIRLGRQNPDHYEVISGLEKGDRVITSQYDHFNNSEILIIKKE